MRVRLFVALFSSAAMVFGRKFLASASVGALFFHLCFWAWFAVVTFAIRRPVPHQKGKRAETKQPKSRLHRTFERLDELLGLSDGPYQD